MNIQIDPSDATYQIKHYEPGKITINDSIYTQSVIVRPHELHHPWEPRTLANLKIDHFGSVYTNPPNILLLGTGEKFVIPSEKLLRPLFEKGIAIEFMDSKAACFTYTILASEGRNVAAAILII